MKHGAWILGAAVGGVASGRRFARRPALPLRGKVVMIAGAATPIGQAAAEAFALAGARLVLITPPGTACDLPGALHLPADPADDSAPERLAAAALERFGRIDVLVTLEGQLSGGLAQETAAARVRATAAELAAIMRLAQAVLPVMLGQGRGQIISVGHVFARVPAPGLALASGARAGLVGFVTALRREVDDAGLRVSLVLAGPDDDPEREARAILDAVRYGWREVITGGALAQAGVWLERLAPWAVDLYWKWMLTPDLLARLSAENK